MPQQRTVTGLAKSLQHQTLLVTAVSASIRGVGADLGACVADAEQILHHVVLLAEARVSARSQTAAGRVAIIRKNGAHIQLWPFFPMTSQRIANEVVGHAVIARNGRRGPAYVRHPSPTELAGGQRMPF
jgi:hypothetical protein